MVTLLGSCCKSITHTKLCISFYLCVSFYCFQRTICQFIAHIYRNVPINSGRTVLLSQCHVRDEINEYLVGYVGSEQDQQVKLMEFYSLSSKLRNLKCFLVWPEADSDPQTDYDCHIQPSVPIVPSPAFKTAKERFTAARTKNENETD